MKRKWFKWTIVLLLLGMVLTSCAVQKTLLPAEGNEFELTFQGEGIYTYLYFQADDGEHYRVDADNVTWVYDRSDSQSEFANANVGGTIKVNETQYQNVAGLTIHLWESKNPILDTK